MVISLEELCGRLGIEEKTEPEHTALEFSSKEFMEAYDGYALPATRVIAPPICEKLRGAKSAVEIGFGSGFRLLYYALNNPQTHFVAIDNDTKVVGNLIKRMDALGAENIEILNGDIFAFGFSNFKHAAVIAIDCLLEELPTQFRGKIDYQAFLRGSLIYFGKMVDSSQQPSFLASVHYGPWTERHPKKYSELMKNSGLFTLESRPFSYEQQGEKSGAVMFASCS